LISFGVNARVNNVRTEGFTKMIISGEKRKRIRHRRRNQQNWRKTIVLLVGEKRKGRLMNNAGG